MEHQINTEVFNMEDIKPAEYNPRTSTEDGKRYLANSFGTFGYVDPIIVNKRTMTIVGGHQRYALMKEKGVKNVEVVVVDFDLKKEEALNIALNKTGEHFEWDDEKLSTMIGEIKDDIAVDAYGVNLESLFGGDLSLDQEIKDKPKPPPRGKPDKGKGSNVDVGETIAEYTCHKCGHVFTKGARREF